MTTRTAMRTEGHSQTAVDLLYGSQLLLAIIEMFLADCRSKRLSPRTVKFYRSYLQAFVEYAISQAAERLDQIDATLLRSYLTWFAEDHNPGGVHCAYRSIRALFHWVEREELMSSDWRNPMSKVSGPRVPEKILEPVPMETVAALINTCKGTDFFNLRDRAIFLLLLDTGARAQELCDLDLSDIDPTACQLNIRHGKGNKARYVFIGRKTLRALRVYLKSRTDQSSPALLVSRTGERLTYDGLREILERRAKKAGLTTMPTLHAFRRAFALDMLRDGTSIYALQRLMGHADTQVLNRYLALTTEDLASAHRQHSPVDRRAWA